jgi:dGTPase
MAPESTFSLERALAESDGLREGRPSGLRAPRIAVDRDYEIALRAIETSQPFATLSEKTQLVSRLYRSDADTRLEHTRAVASLASELAGLLGVDRTLVEAIALGHDVGHPPFGHAGERALRNALDTIGLARHLPSELRGEHHGWSVWRLTADSSIGACAQTGGFPHAVLMGIRDPSIANPLPEARVIGIVDSLASVNGDLADIARCGFRLPRALESAARALGTSTEDRVHRVFEDVTSETEGDHVTLSASLARKFDTTRAALAQFCRSDPSVRQLDEAAEEVITKLIAIRLDMLRPTGARSHDDRDGSIAMPPGTSLAEALLSDVLALGDVRAFQLCADAGVLSEQTMRIYGERQREFW